MVIQGFFDPGCPDLQQGLVGRAPGFTGCIVRPGLYKVEKDNRGSVQADEVVIAQPLEALPEVRLRHGRDFVHHQAARKPQPVPGVRQQVQPEKRRFDRVVVQGISVIEAVSLNWSD